MGVGWPRVRTLLGFGGLFLSPLGLDSSFLIGSTYTLTVCQLEPCCHWGSIATFPFKILLPSLNLSYACDSAHSILGGRSEEKP